MDKEQRYLQRLQEKASASMEPGQNRPMTYDEYGHIFDALHHVFGLPAAKSFIQLCCYLKDSRVGTVRTAVRDLYQNRWSLKPILELQDSVDQGKPRTDFNIRAAGSSRGRTRNVDRYHLHYGTGMDDDRWRFLQDHSLNLTLAQKNSLSVIPAPQSPGLK